MRKLMRNRKAMAWVVLLTFLFTCIVPTGNVALAANNATQPYIYGDNIEEYDIVKINDSDGSFADYSQEGRSVVIGLNSAKSIQIHIPTGVQADKDTILQAIETFKTDYYEQYGENTTESLKTFIPSGVSASATAENLAVVNAGGSNMAKITNNPKDDDSEHFYVLYEKIDEYYGTPIDLKVSIADYEVRENTDVSKKRFGYECLIGLQTVGENEKGFETMAYTPGIAVAGIESVTLKYEFFKSDTFNTGTHTGDAIEVTGSTNYYDVDASQGVIVDGTCQKIYMAEGDMKNDKSINGIDVSKDTCALAVSKTVQGYYHIKDVTTAEAHVVDNNSATGGRVELGYLNAAFSEGFIGESLNRTFTFDKGYAGIYHSGVSVVRTITIEGTKTWEDEDDQDGKRPESITINLLANGEQTQSVTLYKKDFEGKNDWNYQFIDLPRYNADGSEIEYTVTEDDVTGYKFTINGFDIVNKHTPATIKISGEKTWVDDNVDHSNDSITVNLFGVETNYTTKQIITAADNWEYEFKNLPEYHNGQKINYVVTEDKVDGYQTIYEIGTYNIFNVKDDAPDLFMNFPVEKVWDDEDNKAGKRPEKIAVELKVNGQTTGSAVLWDANNWKTEFTNLPRYAADGTTNVYTVEEISVPEGYVSAVVTTMNGAKITNKLCAGAEGEFSVSKKVEGDKAPTDGTFDFNLEVKATEKDWNVVLATEKVFLDKENKEALAAQETAKTQLEQAVGLFGAEVYSTGSAYQFVMKGTSPSSYIFMKTGEEYAQTTDSAYGFFFDGAANHADANSIVKQVVEGIKTLAGKFAELANPVNFLNELQKEVSLNETAVVFEEAKAQNLFKAARTLFDADKRVQATSDAMLTFEQNVPTTPAAITLVMTPKVNNVEGTAEIKTLLPENAVNGVYTIPFSLKEDMEYNFAIKATTGTSIQYVVKEVGGYLTDDYLHTLISMSDKEGSKESRETDMIALTNNSAHSHYMFTNVYDNNTTPPTDPWTPPAKEPEKIPDNPPPTGGTDPEPEPEFVIPGEDVPKGDAEPEPDEELEEPGIPLGDAPPTGDTNNAIPFVVLMLAAVAGLAVTRRKFN